MGKLRKTIELDAFVDNEGNPCCAKDFGAGEVCMFYATKSLGTKEVCTACYNKSLHRRITDRIGTLIPCDRCPVWGK